MSWYEKPGHTIKDNCSPKTQRLLLTPCENDPQIEIMIMPSLHRYHIRECHSMYQSIKLSEPYMIQAIEPRMKV